MASHPHHYQQRHHAATCICCCCSCSCSCYTTTPSHQSPPPQLTDQLLQSLACQILLQQSPQLHHPYYSAYLKPNSSHQNLQHHCHQHHEKQQFQHRHQQQQQEDHQTHTTISSLLNRIDSLESSLHRLASSSSPYHHRFSSIKDIAARTIQIHFRAFLVRRSRTLRNLKDLALIKSAFITLQFSISDQTHIDPEALSRKAMDLLLELDSVQGGDPMIRDGKRAISRDLVRFLDFIDGVSIKRHEFSTKSVNNVKFVQNRNKSRALGTNCRGLGSMDQREIMDNLRAQLRNVSGYVRVSGNDEEEVELEGFHHGSGDEQNAGVSNYRKNGILL